MTMAKKHSVPDAKNIAGLAETYPAKGRRSLRPRATTVAGADRPGCRHAISPTAASAAPRTSSGSMAKGSRSIVRPPNPNTAPIPTCRVAATARGCWLGGPAWGAKGQGAVQTPLAQLGPAAIDRARHSKGPRRAVGVGIQIVHPRLLGPQSVARVRCGGHVAVLGRDKYLTLLACGGVALGSRGAAARGGDADRKAASSTPSATCCGRRSPWVRPGDAAVGRTRHLALRFGG